MFLKGKVACSYTSVFFMIFISRLGGLERIRGDLWRCPGNYLVTSVRWHLQEEATFPSTRSSTVGSRSTVAQCATSHLPETIIWRGTPSFTQGRNRTSAYSATFHATGLQPSKCISRSTPGKICISAINVNIKQHTQANWIGTRRRTLVKSQTAAHHAHIRAF